MVRKRGKSVRAKRPLFNFFSSLRARSPWRSGGGAGKGRRACNYVSEIWIPAWKSRCWLAKVTLVTSSLSLARVFQCLFTFVLVSASLWLAEIWKLSRQGATGNWRWNSNSRDVVASSPSFSRPASRGPRRAFSQAIFLWSSPRDLIPLSPNREPKALCWKYLNYEQDALRALTRWVLSSLFTCIKKNKKSCFSYVFV